MKKSELFKVFTLNLLLIYSCSKEPGKLENESLQPQTENVVSYGKNESLCEYKEKMALLVSKIIDEQLAVNFILERAKERENGELSFLYTLSKDKLINQGKSFANFLDEIENSSENFYSERLSSLDPLLSLSVFLPADYDIESIKTISKVYYYCSINEPAIEEQLFYFVKGIKYNTSISKIPTEPVIIIQHNDRITLRSKNANLVEDDFHKIIGSDEINTFVLNGMTINQHETKLQKENNDKLLPRTCNRDTYKDWEGCRALIFHDDHESWIQGGPEIVISVLQYYNGGPQTLSNQYNYSANARHDPLYPSHRPYIWYTNYYSNEKMIYHYYEKDGGSNTGAFAVGMTVLGVGLNFSFGNTDDDLYGQSDVYYCDYVDPTPIVLGSHYYAGDVEFWVNVKP